MFNQLLVLGAARGNFDIGSFLQNSITTVEFWISLAVMLLGIVAIGVSIWMIVTGLMSQGKKQTNWFIAIALLLVGGAIATRTGFDFVQGIAEGGKTTIEDLGSGKKR